MTREDIDNIISIICPNDEDFETPIISPAYLKKELETLALEGEPRKITFEDIKGYCKPRCLTIIDNTLLYELTHPKIKTLVQEPSGDVISRQAVLNILNEDIDYILKVDSINNLPSVSPTRQKGEWILLENCSNDGYYCNQCNKKVAKEGWSDTVKKINFCPNCGADMRGDNNENR